MLGEKSSVKFGNSMSRLAKKPIVIPAKTEISISGNSITVKGPLGELVRTFPFTVKIEKEGETLTVALATNDRLARPMAGTTVAHLKNMISGVNTLYEKKLIIEGVGFKADVKGTDLVLAIGFSHPVILAIPKSLKVTSEKGTMAISGISKDEVGAFAAKIRSFKVPEPYKGKGIRYIDEVIRRKQGKKTA